MGWHKTGQDENDFNCDVEADDLNHDDDDGDLDYDVDDDELNHVDVYDDGPMIPVSILKCKWLYW